MLGLWKNRLEILALLALLVWSSASPGQDSGLSALDQIAFQSRNAVVQSTEPGAIQAPTGKGRAIGPLVDDWTFARRISLDLTGRLPSFEVAKAFAADKHPEKRRQFIETLLASEAYVDRWTYFFGDLFYVHALIPQATARNAFHFHLRDLVARNAPWDEMFRIILTETGASTRPDSSFFFYAMEGFEEDFRLDFLDDQTSLIAEIGLGVQVDCISCHNGRFHLEEVNKGLSVMSRQDFWGLAAFLSSTYFYIAEYSGPFGDDQDAIVRALSIVDSDKGGFNPSPGVLISEPRFEDGQYHAVSSAGEGMRVPRNGGIIEPKYPFTGETPLPGETRRAALARIMTADRQFARNMVNRIWKHFFGEGFVEPVSGWDLGRLNPELAAGFDTTVQVRDAPMMEFLTDSFIRADFDMKALIRLIGNSRVYQLDFMLNPANPALGDAGRWEDNRRLRRLEAEAIVDSVNQVAGLDHPYMFLGVCDRKFYSVWSIPGSEEPNPFAVYGPPCFDGNVDFAALGYPSAEAYTFIQYFTLDLLNVMGRPDRENRIIRDDSVSIPFALAAQNNFLFYYNLLGDSNNGLIDSLLVRLGDDSAVLPEVVDELFLRALFRMPTPAESDLALVYFNPQNPRQSLADLLWTLLNHPDFLFK